MSDDETESWRVTAPHSDGDTRSEDEIMAEYLAGTGTVTAVDPGVSSVIEEALAAPTVMTVEEQKAQPTWKPDPDKVEQVAQVEYKALPMLQRLIAAGSLVTFMLRNGQTLTGVPVMGDSDGSPEYPYLFVQEPAHDVVGDDGVVQRTTPVTWRIPKDRIDGVGEFIE